MRLSIAVPVSCTRLRFFSVLSHFLSSAVGNCFFVLCYFFVFLIISGGESHVFFPHFFFPVQHTTNRIGNGLPCFLFVDKIRTRLVNVMNTTTTAAHPTCRLQNMGTKRGKHEKHIVYRLPLQVRKLGVRRHILHTHAKKEIKKE